MSFEYDENGNVIISPDVQMRWAGVPPRFAGCSWESLMLRLDKELSHLGTSDAGRIRKSLEWFRTWDRNSEIMMVVLQAPPGRGKTVLAGAAIRRALRHSPKWTEWPSLLTRVSDSWHNGGERLVVAPVKTCLFSVLDDFGKGAAVGSSGSTNVSGWQRRIAYEIINHRYTHFLPTVITTELSPGQMVEQIDPALVSRILENGRWIDLSPLPDLRIGGTR